MVRSLVFAFPVVPRNYTWFDAANNRGLAPLKASDFALRAFCEVPNPSTVSGTRGLRVLTIPGRSYRIRLHESACYPSGPRGKTDCSMRFIPTRPYGLA